jgi:hypothetical protein
LLRIYFAYGSKKKLPNKFYNTNEEDTEILENLRGVEKMAYERKQAVIACLEVDDDDKKEWLLLQYTIFASV